MRAFSCKLSGVTFAEVFFHHPQFNQSLRTGSGIVAGSVVHDCAWGRQQCFRVRVRRGTDSPRLFVWISADRIVSIFKQNRYGEAGPLSRNEYHSLGQQVDAFDWIEAARITPSDIMMGDRSEIAIVAAVMPKLAAVLKVPLGNGVVLSYRMWQSDFGGRTDVIENHIRIDNVDFPITGVAPIQLEGLYRNRPTDIWMPLQAATLQGAERSGRDLWVFARLRRTVSPGQAQAAVHLKFGNSGELSVIPFTGTPPRMAQGLSRINRLLNFAAGAVFFIACINVGSLLLGRALRRSGETSLRVALGATRAKLIGELLSDSIVISLAGGLSGMLLAVLVRTCDAGSSL